MLLLMLLLLSATPTEAAAPQRTISVSGTAEVRVAPDIVQIMLAVETADKVLAKAKADNDQRSAKTLAAIKKFGIESKDVQTDRLNIDAIYENGVRNRNDPDAYLVRKSIVVTLNDVKRFEDLLETLLTAGANRTDGIEFRTSALRKHRDTARAQALKAAREKATAMAAELGSKIGKPLTITESSSRFGMWAWSGSRGGGMQQNAFSGGGGSSESAEGFAPGQIAVSAEVNVTFSME